MNALFLLGCKTSLWAPVRYSLGVITVLPQQRNALLLLSSWGIADWALCIQHFSCSPCSPSISRFLTTHTGIFFVVEIYRHESNTELEQETDIEWLVISMDWTSTYRLSISRNNMVVWQVHVFCRDVTWDWPQPCPGWYRHGMLTIPQDLCVVAMLGQKVRAQPVRINLTLSGVRKDPAGYRWSPAGGSVELVYWWQLSSGSGT